MNPVPPKYGDLSTILNEWVTPPKVKHQLEGLFQKSLSDEDDVKRTTSTSGVPETSFQKTPLTMAKSLPSIAPQEEEKKEEEEKGKKKRRRRSEVEGGRVPSSLKNDGRKKSKGRVKGNED